MADRFRGALLGVAIGDALGASLEGRTPVDRAALASWIASPPDPLRYTDDTGMMLATARSLVQCDGFRGGHMVDSLAAQYGIQPGRAEGDRPHPDIDVPGDGRPWDEYALDLFGDTGSFENGAALRIAPIGLAYSPRPQRAVEIAREVARITHSHPIGEDGAALQAGAIAEVLWARDLQPAALLGRLQGYVRTRWFRELLDSVGAVVDDSAETVVSVLGNGVEAHRSVPTALCCFLRHRESFTDAVLFALSLGGDADAIASMTGALAGASGGASAIAAAWSDRIEGREELLELADRLLELAGLGG